MEFKNRLRKFRTENGLSQEELARLLGVGKITVLRWENGTSKPSPLAAERLSNLGLGPLSASDTKLVSRPRLHLASDSDVDLRADIRKTVLLDDEALEFDPSPYVFNGPEDQLPFFEEMYYLQDQKALAVTPTDYARRLSCVAQVPQLRVETAQYLLERPKFTAKHWNANYGSHGWHRYVGRFPPHLVRSLINHFQLGPRNVVCDPFLGSGTTLVEARLLGLSGIGIEICPLSSLVSRTKAAFPENPDGLLWLQAELRDFYVNRWEEFAGGRDIRGLDHQDVLAREGNLIPHFENVQKWFIPEALLGTSIVVEFLDQLEGYERDLLCTLLSSKMRSIGNVDVDVVRAEYRRTPRETVDVLGLVQRALRKVLSDIKAMAESHTKLLSQPEDVVVVEGSTLEVDLYPESVDCIITSPPYGVESLSYLRTHLLSYRSLRSVLKRDPYAFDDQIIGSEYLSNGDLDWSEFAASSRSASFNSFFESIPEGEVTKSLRRRTNMMMRFFDDMAACADRFYEWLRPGGPVAFVVGNKRLGTELIPTDAIVTELFASAGFNFERSIQHKLKCNNSNSEVPWQERTIQDEYVLVFRKPQ